MSFVACPVQKKKSNMHFQSNRYYVIISPCSGATDMTLDKLAHTKLMLCIGLMQVAAYYLAGMLASPDGSMAVPQPDTLLYCQAARRIVEGHPFSFSEGAAVCTGTTSVLYPFILAVPYMLGAHGDALLTAGFLLNALFYLVFLLGWAKALQVWIYRPIARLVSALLIALSGQIAFCAMAQSDIGCWLAVSGWLAAGLATRKRWLYGGLLILGPWIRPEGMVCVIAFGMFVLLETIARKKKTEAETAPSTNSGDWLVLILAILSTLGVFMLNFALTGQFQFASVANKGYFKAYPFATAIDRLAVDGVSLLKDYLFGMAVTSPRDMLMIPFLAAVFIWIGIFRYQWKQSKAMGLPVFILAVGGGFLTVAQSGWQGTNFDRYLAWTTPVFLLFLAEGIAIITDRLKEKGALFVLPAAVCLLFAASTAFTSVCRFNHYSTRTDLLRLFSHEVDKTLPALASIGSFGESGVAYGLGKRHYKHLHGIYSPEFRVKSQAAAIEILKNEPKNRFDFWFITPSQRIQAFYGNNEACYGENILTGPDGMEIRKAAWEALDQATSPQIAVPTDKRLVCKIDVGYEPDEKRSAYEIIDRYGRQPTKPFIIADKLNGKLAIDSARLLVGGDAMSVPLESGKDVTIVMRTFPKHTDVRPDSFRAASSVYAFANPLTLNVAVNDQPLQAVSISYATNGFSDVSFTIPGTSIDKESCRIAFLGDHIAAGYWFYQ